MNIDLITLSHAVESVQRREINATDLAGLCLERIERLDPRFKAFISVQKPRGDVIDGPLAGIPIALKDLFETAGIPTTAGSKFFRDHVPASDAPVVEKLKSAGAFIIGKTNLHEIALGVTNDNPYFGTCRNPWDERRIPGGSSGGSAVAVATGMALGALGSDTGGSIRIPAALCGIVGLKPTYGRVSLRGVVPLSWNLDHAGPMGRCVRDVAQLLQVIAGYDPLDPCSQDARPDDYLSALGAGIEGWKVALATGEYFLGTDLEVQEAINQAAALLAGLGANVTEVDLSFLREAAIANSQMTQADAAAFHRQRLQDHPDWFGADVLQRLQNGVNLTSSEYSLARRTQSEMRLRMNEFFAEYDLLLTPTTPIAAPLIEGADAVEQARQLTRYTAPFNLTGLPALSVPCGFTSNGLPIGLQIIAGAWSEKKVLQAGWIFEKNISPRFRFPGETKPGKG